ncbi:MAG: glycosyltransferase [Desulfovibrio sp.]|jgi:glycosyltransferase involved in cell wall biosynthesis|nr:glycosyltransferase [Desulfovibrio sp.]
MSKQEQKLRVVEVVNVRWFNATAWYGVNLSRLLRAFGHETLVLALPGTDTFAAAQKFNLSPLPLNTNSANPYETAHVLIRMRRLLEGFRPHLVNCHRGEGLIFWGLLKKFFPFALVRTRGDQRAPKGNFPNRFLHGKTIDAVIATNSRTLEQCRGILHVPDARLHLIPGGVDTKRFFPDPAAKAETRRNLGFAPDDFVIGLLGRFDPVKGHAQLIEALARVIRMGDAPPSRPRLFFIGLPAAFTKETLMATARAHGLESVTVVAPEKADVPACINALDLGVCASQGSEAIARAALEIMACSVPLAGTDVGVMPDLLAPEALVPAGDCAALAALIRRTLTEDDFRAHLVLTQKKRLTSLTDEDFLQNTLAVYHAAVERAARQRGKGR